MAFRKSDWFLVKKQFPVKTRLKPRLGLASGMFAEKNSPWHRSLSVQQVRCTGSFHFFSGTKRCRLSSIHQSCLHFHRDCLLPMAKWLDTSGHIWTHLDTSGHIWTHLDTWIITALEVTYPFWGVSNTCRLISMFGPVCDDLGRNAKFNDTGCAGRARRVSRKHAFIVQNKICQLIWQIGW